MLLWESIIEQPWWFFWDTATIIFDIFFQFLFQRQFKKNIALPSIQEVS